MHNTRGLDSFKLLVEATKCTYDTRLNKKVYEVYYDFESTGEIIKEYNTKPLVVSELGIDTHYGYISLFGKAYIYILLNSKMLKERYFESINHNTVQILYSHIKSQNIVSLTYDEFLNSKLTDIDIKSDFDMVDEQFYKLLSDRKRALVYPKFFSKRPNLGIEYSKRHSATPSNPYVKYYSKSHELFTRSRPFKDAYLPDFHNENLRRCEVTIKNHAHRQYVSSKLFELPTTLKEWTSLTQDQYKAIIVHCIEQHERNVTIPIDREKYERNIYSLTSRDYMFYRMYRELLALGQTDEFILNLYNKRDGKPDSVHYSEKTRLKKLIRKIREVDKNTLRLDSPFL